MFIYIYVLFLYVFIGQPYSLQGLVYAKMRRKFQSSGETDRAINATIIQVLSLGQHTHTHTYSVPGPVLSLRLQRLGFCSQRAQHLLEETCP